MLKNKLDYKLVNLVLISLIVFLLYQTGNLWTGVIGKILEITLPFLFAFAIAYALYPFLQIMNEKKIPNELRDVIPVTADYDGVVWILYGSSFHDRRKR